MKFISYDGDWPNLCRGTLVVEKDGNQYSIYGALISGGWCGFDPDGEDQVEEGPWIIDPDELPNELKNDNDIAELEEQKRAIDEKIATSKKAIKRVESVIRDLQERMSIADFAEAVGDMLPEGLFDEMVDKEFWCCTTLPDEGVDENVMYILNIRDVSLRKGGLESLPFMYEEYGDWEMYKNAAEYLKYQRIISAYAKTLPIKAEYISKLYYDKEEGLQCVSAYKINLEKKLTKEYAKEIVAKLTDGFVYEK